MRLELREEWKVLVWKDVAKEEGVIIYVHWAKAKNRTAEVTEVAAE